MQTVLLYLILFRSCDTLKITFFNRQYLENRRSILNQWKYPKIPGVAFEISKVDILLPVPVTDGISLNNSNILNVNEYLIPINF